VTKHRHDDFSYRDSLFSSLASSELYVHISLNMMISLYNHYINWKTSRGRKWDSTSSIIFFLFFATKNLLSQSNYFFVDTMLWNHESQFQIKSDITFTLQCFQMKEVETRIHLPCFDIDVNTIQFKFQDSYMIFNCLPRFLSFLFALPWGWFLEFALGLGSMRCSSISFICHPLNL